MRKGETKTRLTVTMPKEYALFLKCLALREQKTVYELIKDAYPMDRKAGNTK